MLMMIWMIVLEHSPPCKEKPLHEFWNLKAERCYENEELAKKQILNQSRDKLLDHLSEDAKAYYKEFPERPDVQARPGLKMALENILTGRKPKLRVKGSVDKSALPDGVLIADLTTEGGGVTIIGSKLPKSWLF